MTQISKSENQDPSRRIVRISSAIGILLLSCFLFSGCGKKEDAAKPGATLSPLPAPNPTAPTPANPSNPTPPVSVGRHLEDALPGNSLLKGNYSNAAFQMMDKNLTGTATFTVTSQQGYDYTINSGSGAAPQINRQDSTGPNQTAVPVTYQAQAGQDSNWGRYSITLMTPPNINEPWHTFVFQYQVNVSGITLSSTDQVALFKAVEPTPYTTDFLEVAYTSQNPSIQRFRVAPLNPYQLGTPIPTSGNYYGSVWLHVVGQMITTQFRLMPH